MNEFILDDNYMEEKSLFDIEFDKQQDRWDFFDEEFVMVYDLEFYY